MAAFQVSHYAPLVIPTEEVMGLRPTQGDENGFCSATTLNGSAALPFVISTGAPKEHSGEIWVQRSFPGNVFRPERSAAVEGSAVLPPQPTPPGTLLPGSSGESAGDVRKSFDRDSPQLSLRKPISPSLISPASL
jgi:hypothetical protein